MDTLTIREKQISFQITSFCTLNCKLCSTLQPVFRKKRLCKHIPLNQVKDEISVVFRMYNFIRDVTISGGEPFLHPNLDEILLFCLEYKHQFESLRVFSNGTIVPTKNQMEIFKAHQNLLLVIDDYGPERSKKVGEILELFEKNGLPICVNTYWGKEQHCDGWVDFGCMKTHRGYSPEEVVKIFCSCHPAQYKCLTVYDGILGNCAWSVFGYKAGYFPTTDASSEFVDLLNPSISIKEKKIRAERFGKIPLTACQYCNGFDVEKSKRYPAGEQQ